MNQIASGITGASPIWNQIMTKLLENIPDKEFAKPEGLTKVEICHTTGTLSCQSCGGYFEYFIAGTEPQEHCFTQEKKKDEISEEGQIIGRSVRPKPKPTKKPKFELFNLRRLE